MKLVNLLPEKFVESEFVTRVREKCENDPSAKFIYYTICATTGVSLAGITMMAVAYRAMKKNLEESNED
jgi:hypothetical protein